MGARYCSIQGKLAAQLRLQDKASQKIYTLYQVSGNAYDLPSPHEVRTIDLDGIRVKIWQEKGVWLALAG